MLSDVRSAKTGLGAGHRSWGRGGGLRALVLGTRDYLHKTGFQEALVALSGGIDSSLVAAIAVDAIGAENVRRCAHAVAVLV